MKEIFFYITTILVALTILFIAWVFKSEMEAKTYTELTGKKVTTYQAMWVDLRVVEPATGKN